jgi:hypothetical protein
MPDNNVKNMQSDVLARDRLVSMMGYPVRCSILFVDCFANASAVNAVAFVVYIYCDFTAVGRERGRLPGAIHALVRSVSHSILTSNSRPRLFQHRVPPFDRPDHLSLAP